MKIRVIIEHRLEEVVLETKAKNVDDLLKELNLKKENCVIVKNKKVVTKLSETLKDGDVIRILEAVGGG